VWASAAEGVRLAEEITRMVEEVRALGPLNWPGRTNGHLEALEQAAQQAEGEPV